MLSDKKRKHRKTSCLEEFYNIITIFRNDTTQYYHFIKAKLSPLNMSYSVSRAWNTLTVLLAGGWGVTLPTKNKSVSQK